MCTVSGRTGRAQNVGDAFTLMSGPGAARVAGKSKRFIGQKIPRLKLENFAYLYTALFEPESAGGGSFAQLVAAELIADIPLEEGDEVCTSWDHAVAGIGDPGPACSVTALATRPRPARASRQNRSTSPARTGFSFT